MCCYHKPYLFILSYRSICTCCCRSFGPCYLSFNLSISLLICLPINHSIYHIYLSIVSIHLSIYQSICPPINLSICRPINQSLYISIHQSIYLFIYLSIHLCIYLSTHLSIYLSTNLCMYLSSNYILTATVTAALPSPWYSVSYF